MEIIFLGGAKEVGASSCLIRVSNKNILIDCGIRMKEEKLPNLQLLKDFGGVDLCLISHAHLDHCGALPLIAREFGNVFFYTTHATKDLIKVLLYDSLRLMDQAEEEIPIYAEKNVEDFLDRTITYSFYWTFTPFENISITFFPSGHILGASFIFIHTKEGSILYTGDYSMSNQLTVDRASIPKTRPDILITESTYGDRLHINRSFEEERLYEMILETLNNGGKVLIPVFAIGRAQEIILILKRFMRKKKSSFNVYIDGMVKEIVKVYENNPNFISSRYAKKILKGEEIFRGENITFVKDKKQREKVIIEKDPCVIVSSSGMLSGGPSLFYATHLFADEKNMIALVGYQDEESPGNKLLQISELPTTVDRVIEIGGQYYKINCKISKFGLSAHSDKTEILGLISALKPKSVVFVHGSEEAISQLAETCVKENNSSVYTPSNCELLKINVEKPQKQLAFFNVSKLLKEESLNENNIRELWEHLIKNGQEKNHISPEHAMLIWNGYKSIEKEEIARIYELMKSSVYFEKNPKRPFLFKILSPNEVEEKIKPKPYEQNKFREMAMELFNQYGLYKVGLDDKQKKAIFYFNFPAVYNNIKDKIESFSKETLWDIEISKTVNTTYANGLIDEMLKKYDIVYRKISYIPNANKIIIKVDQFNNMFEKIAKDFYEISQINLEFELPIEKRQLDSSKIDKMEQNKVMLLIDLEFQKYPHKIYKKSIKNNGEYIELSFISPAIGQKYIEIINNISNVTKWKIKISPSINQHQLNIIVKELLGKYNICLDKNPSFKPLENKLLIKINQKLDNNLLNNIIEEFYEVTGIILEIEENKK